MKSLNILILFVCMVNHASAQWSKDEKKIIRIMDKAVVKVEPRLQPGVLKDQVYLKYPSESIHDTSTTVVGGYTGVSFQGEYIDHTECYEDSKDAISNFATTNLVTVGEYDEFIKYVRDSMAREEMFLKHADDYDAEPYLDYGEFYFDEEELEWVDTEIADRKKSRDAWPLNYKKKIDFERGIYEPIILRNYYLPRSERINKCKKLDDRNLMFSYYKIDYRNAAIHTPKQDSIKKSQSGAIRGHEYRSRFIIDYNVPVYVDDMKWALKAKHNFDEYAVLSQVYRITEKDAPMVGITGVQAAAFCHWKEEQINKQWGYEYALQFANVTLPSPEELNYEMQTPCWTFSEHDFTDQWAITREEYQEFYTHVRDSTLAEYMYLNLKDDQQALRLLLYIDFYLDEGALEYVELEPSDRFYNRNLYPLNLNMKKVSKDPQWSSLLTDFNNKMEGKSLYYHYTYVDVMRKRELGAVEATLVESQGVKMYNSVPYKCEDELTGDTWDCFGKDLILDQVNKRGEAAGVRAHKNLAQYNTEVKIAVSSPGVPVTKENREDNMVSELSYEQALAFYHWKYPIWQATEDDWWGQYIFPSEEEFSKLQQGITVVKPAMEMEAPTPAFRYVVHID